MIKVKNFLGGSGGEKASVFITGLSQSDVVTVTSPSGKNVAVDWIGERFLFSATEYGNYSVTYSNGTKTKTENVLVDMATEYVIELDFKTWLYKYGEEYGHGWHEGSRSGGTFSKRIDLMHYESTYAYTSIVTTDRVDVTPFVKYGAKVRINSKNGTPQVAMRLCTNADGDSGNQVANSGIAITSTGEMILEKDITSVSGSLYVSVQPNSRINGTSTVINIDVLGVWLE